ncbi:hypothetical protein DFS34DRAFT_650662 [Phlyctochytrium arcticum]|nr:hypothetical protein DFS34DRAFT_650662 [Phlyctochytrium arcticum]
MPKKKVARSESTSSNSDSEHDSTSPSISSEWPCPAVSVAQARAFVKNVISSAHSPNRPILLLPDKDADGLSAGVCMHHTLTALGVPTEHIKIIFVAKGSNVFRSEERERFAEAKPDSLILLDQGSRASDAFIEGVPTLIIDHHASSVFPTGATVLSSYGTHPNAPASMLTFTLCDSLLDGAADRLVWLALVGTTGDMGAGLKWSERPWPDLYARLKAQGMGITKKSVSDCVSLLNAPRRTPASDAIPAWGALLAATSPSDFTRADLNSSDVQNLRECKDFVTTETARWVRVPPRFSEDGQIAMIRISSDCQIHPLVAARWSRSLKSSQLRFLVVANDKYLPGRTNFTCRRVPSSPPHLDIISELETLVAKKDGLRTRCGTEFANGHPGATGGSIEHEVFKEVMEVMGFETNGGGKRKREKTQNPAAKGTAALEKFGFTKIPKKTSV